MHSRRFACLLIGLWLGGAFLMAWIAVENRSLSARVATPADPAAMLRIRVLGTAETTALLRHEAAEQTRNQLEIWEYAQLALGTFLFSFLLFGTGEGKVSLALALAMLIGVVVQRFALTPQLDSLGRLTDFVTTEPSGAFRARLVVLEGAYTGIELTKWILGAALAAVLVGRRRRTHLGDSWQQFNVVDKADHRHVDR